VIHSGSSRRPRSRRVCIAIVVIVVILGLASRRYRDVLPPFVAAYSGDTLWANMVLWLFAIVMPRARTMAVAAAALAFAYAIEISQLYHASWIDSIRATTIGGLVLGSDFVWSDLVCYTVGVVAGAVLDLPMISSRRTG
jgi:hypothetical protein